MSEEKEIIVGIDEFTDIPLRGDGINHDIYAGYCVTTSRQEIFVAISAYQDCCEHWGYLVMNDDDKEAFVGAELRNITTTDTALNTKALEDLNKQQVYASECVFVNLETDRGTLQFAAYNSHNGYYGHEVVIRSEQLKLETTI